MSVNEIGTKRCHIALFCGNRIRFLLSWPIKDNHDPFQYC